MRYASLLTTQRFLTLCAAAVFAIAGASSVDAATIAVGNSAVSSEINEPAGDSNDDVGSIASYNNDGEFLLVGITMSTGTNAVNQSYDPANMEVTFAGSALTMAANSRRSNDEWSFVFYHANPTVGSGALTVDFNADVLISNGNGEGAFQFGALSLFNVDESDPFAGITVNTSVGSLTINADTAGEIGAGDLVFTSTVSRTDDANHFATPTAGQTALISNGTPADAPSGESSHSYQSIYQVLTAGDISGDSVALTDAGGQGGIAANTGLVVNAIPEPGSLALMGLGGLMILARRRTTARD